MTEKIKKIVIRKPKYKLLEESVELNGVKLFRIESIKTFSDVKSGDKGGFIEKENNLSHSRTCWVYDDSKVYGDAKIRGYAKICENSIVYGDTLIRGKAVIKEGSTVCGETLIRGEEVISGGSTVDRSKKKEATPDETIEAVPAETTPV